MEDTRSGHTVASDSQSEEILPPVSRFDGDVAFEILDGGAETPCLYSTENRDEYVGRGKTLREMVAARPAGLFGEATR